MCLQHLCVRKWNTIKRFITKARRHQSGLLRFMHIIGIRKHILYTVIVVVNNNLCTTHKTYRVLDSRRNVYKAVPESDHAYAVLEISARVNGRGQNNSHRYPFKTSEPIWIRF